MLNQKQNMKAIYPMGVAVVALLIAGCEPRTEQEGRYEAPPEIKTEEVEREVGQAVDATKRYAAENKDEFVAAMDRKLEQLDDEIDRLGEKAENLAGEAKVEAKQALDNLRVQRAKLDKSLQELKDSSRETWSDVKSGFESAMNELEKSYENLKTRFSN